MRRNFIDKTYGQWRIVKCSLGPAKARLSTRVVPTPLIAETAVMTAPGEFAPLAPPRRRLRPRTVVGLIVVVLLVGVPALVRIFFLEAFKIPHAGMSPTLLAGDHILVRKDAYGTRSHRTPARGDVVVFRHPEHPEQDFVQRVIGLPGDTITVQEAAIFINGWRIPTCVAGFGELEVGDEKRVGIAVVELLGDTAYLVFHDQQKVCEPARARGRGRVRRNPKTITRPPHPKDRTRCRRARCSFLATTARTASIRATGSKGAAGAFASTRSRGAQARSGWPARKMAAPTVRESVSI
jgi:signal peptidase I